MLTIERKHFLLVLIALAVLVSVLMLPRSPLQRNVPPRDSGVFLYVGQQILEGQLPYRDVWDHKGPVIYYLNALGLLLGNGSRWGVWWLQWISILAASLLGYSALKGVYGHRPATFATLAWLISLTVVLGGGNYTEEFALPLQFGALYLFWKSGQSDRPLKQVLLIGVTLAAAFWLRPNTIGVQAAITIVALLAIFRSARYGRAFYWLAALTAGFLLFSLPMLGYFAWNGVLDEFMDAVFRYNFIYAATDFGNRWDSILEGLSLLSQTGFTFVAIAAWITGCFSYFSKNKLGGKQFPFLQVALIGLPIELFFASASGRTYFHYYMSLLPVFALLSAYAVSEFLSHFKPPESTLEGSSLDFKLIWVSAFLFAMVLPIGNDIFNPVQEFVQGDRPGTSIVVKTIWDRTDEDDTLLMWGAEAKYNFMADRRSPSRYVSQYPLYTCGYVNDAMIAEFLSDLEQHKPLIIDTSPSNKFIPPLNPDKLISWDGPVFAGSGSGNCGLSPRMTEVFDFIDSHYRVVDVIKSKGWDIYEYSSNE